MRYRDKLTGRFVEKTTWVRSKAHGGTRYVRQSQKSRGGDDSHAPLAQKRAKRESSGGGVSPSAAKSESRPAPEKIKTAKDYEDYYDDFLDYEDYGEIETGIDY